MKLTFKKIPAEAALLIAMLNKGFHRVKPPIHREANGLKTEPNVTFKRTGQNHNCLAGLISPGSTLAI